MKSFMAIKSAGGEAVTSEQLDRINLFSRRELTAEEVYIFTVILCDNEIDRDGEQFTVESLEALSELFIGKTGVFDHDPKAENQSARIFEAELVREERENTIGDQYCCLKARAYMVRCDKNADLILEIDAGIKKEVSVGCAVEQVLCSVCGVNQKASSCSHTKGNTYDGALCYHKLVNPTDAYEWSFVAVPAQKNAGVIKKMKFPKGEYYLELAKLFDASGDVRLTKTELASLKREYAALAELAKAGETYIASLRREVVKLASLADPALSPKLMEVVAAKLGIGELSELKKTFGASAAKAYPVMPQLAAEDSPAANPADNQFKI